MRILFSLLLATASPAIVIAQDGTNRPRAREMGVAPGIFAPGPLNAITDVPGGEVGHATINTGSGRSAVRTGVTAVFPRGKTFDPVFAGYFAGNERA